MPRAKESTKVDIQQSTEGDLRIIVVKLTAPAKDFVLPDVLSQEGAIEPYERTLREAVKGATEGYLRGALDAVAAIVARNQERQASATARAPKEVGASKVAKPKPGTRPDESTPAQQASRAVPERVNGPNAS